MRAEPAVLAVVTQAQAAARDESLRRELPTEELALVTLRGGLDEAMRAYPAVRERLEASGLIVTCTGRVPFLHDLDATLERDLLRAEAISLPIAIMVLLAVFLTFVAALVPVGVGALAVLSGIAIVLLLSHRYDVAQYTINVCSLIGLGVSIDYSLFIVSRYREELASGHDYPDALAKALSSAGRVVAFSGFAVGTSLVGLFFFRDSYLVAMGMGGAVVVALAVLFALTFLPALLAVLGPRIHAGRLPFRRRERRGLAWHRIAMGVMRRPLWVLLPTLAILVWMGMPFLHLRMTGSDVRVLPAEIRGAPRLRAFAPALSRAGRDTHLGSGSIPDPTRHHVVARRGAVRFVPAHRRAPQRDRSPGSHRSQVSALSRAIRGRFGGAAATHGGAHRGGKEDLGTRG